MKSVDQSFSLYLSFNPYLSLSCHLYLSLYSLISFFLYHSFVHGRLLFLFLLIQYKTPHFFQCRRNCNYTAQRRTALLTSANVNYANYSNHCNLTFAAVEYVRFLGGAFSLQLSVQHLKKELISIWIMSERSKWLNQWSIAERRT